MKLEKIDLELTSKYNLKCSHCYASSTKLNGTEMSLKNAIQLVQEFADCGGNRIALTGGEPTLHKNFMEIFDYAADFGLKIELETNGSLFNEKFVEKIYCKRDNIRYVQISLDGATAETHDKIRGAKSSFEKAVNAIKLCNSKKIPVRVSTVLSDENKNEVMKILELVQNLDIVDYRVDAIVPTGNGTNNRIKIDDYVKIIKELGAMEEKNENTKVVMPVCGVGESRVAVLSDGTITPCPMIRSLVIGNAFERGTLKNSLNSKISKKVRNGFKFCNNCEKKLKCGRGCKARAFAITHDLNAPDLYRCALFY